MLLKTFVVSMLLFATNVAAQKRINKYKVTCKNIAYSQPMSPFFVAVHKAKTTPIFELGKEASPELGFLAEEGNPERLIELYSEGGDESFGVLFARQEGNGPLFLGDEFSFTVMTRGKFKYLSMASMAVNTNDCFVGFTDILLKDGLHLYSPGYDSGTELNNQLCTSVPGPACQNTTLDEDPGENGEGFVHIHRGIHQVGDLDPARYDWRNPMLYCSVEQIP